MKHINISDIATNNNLRGEIEFIIKDRNGNVVENYITPNVIKIFAKEMLSHRLPSSEIWDTTANSGTGGWISSDIDPTEEFSARYILLGASFDDNGLPLDTNDPRYYGTDPITQKIVPIKLSPGAEYNGGLVNSIPLAEPDRPLKRVEEIEYQASYQPAGNPVIQSDVRGLNNVVKFKTTLKLDEYNGFNTSESDFFTITEVALAGGKKFDSINTCECTPETLFLEGTSNGSSGSETTESPILATANSSDVISIDPSVINVDQIKVGDQIKIVGTTDSKTENTISQTTPYYLVLSKLTGGRDIQLDRTPVDTDNNPLSGQIGLYRSSLRIFSHRILSVPVKKSNNFEITIIWTIIFN